MQVLLGVQKFEQVEYELGKGLKHLLKGYDRPIGIAASEVIGRYTRTSSGLL